nr:unnamed protein product [Spirometra erinaceieuropaei]
MGSPLGPVLANAFMGKVEMTSLQDTINDLRFYGRYVDDIFCLTDVTTDTDALIQQFTPLANDLAIETIELLLQSKYDETENCPVHAQILQHLKLCLRTYFTFDGTIYEQVKGTPMGSPISGFIVEAVLQRLESLIFQHHRPKFWTRYADDTFVVINRDQVLTFKNHLNAVFPDIQFTMEEEENNQLAFLDVLVCRKDCGGLKTKVFRKATNTMQVLNFNSNHPISHRRSCVRTLYRHVETHCREPEDKITEIHNDDLLKKELGYIYRLFRSNGYPVSFVKNYLRRRAQTRGPSSDGETVTEKFLPLPYMQGTSELIARQLNHFGIRVSHKPASSLRTVLIRVKDSISKEEQTNVLYRIPCANCPCVYCDHRFNWDNTEVNATANTKRAREVLEAWHSNADSINRHVDLDAHYEGLRSRLTKPSPTPHQQPLIQAPAALPTNHSPSPPTRGAVTFPPSPFLPSRLRTQHDAPIPPHTLMVCPSMFVLSRLLV